MCWLLIFIAFSVHALDYYDILEYLYSVRRNDPSVPNYNETNFGALDNYQVNASPVTEEQYPWIARVVHSRASFIPHLCTAVCVEQRIFITSARCTHSAIVFYTSVIYQKHQFPAIAFVRPKVKSKEKFDDIGFIVVNDDYFEGQWPTVRLFDTTNRTDENFEWFAKLKLSDDVTEHVVVGYAMKKGLHLIPSIDIQYNLTELKVVVDINLCPEILIFKNLISGFNVPCYHSCSVKQFQNNDPLCTNYHGVVGGAVFNIKTEKLLGISSWGSTFYKHTLPVGFSVPNSNEFFLDFTCARRIREDKTLPVAKDYYQGLCDDLNKNS